MTLQPLPLALEPRPRNREAEVLLHEHLDVEEFIGRGVFADPGEEEGEILGHAPIFEQDQARDQSRFFTEEEP